MTPPQLQTADRYYAQSAAIARRASREAAKRGAQTGTVASAALVIAQYQAAQASQVPANALAMLAEQGVTALAEGVLQPLAFATPLPNIEAMLVEIQRDLTRDLEADIEVEMQRLWTDWRFERLAESLVQDAGRAAQQVDMTTRPRIAHVRHLNLPSCSRCAILAGRVYRWSEMFQRHPGCDCVMIPTTLANDSLTYDMDELVKSGQVAGLSKADRRALSDGADLNQLVNARRSGLHRLNFGKRGTVTTTSEGVTSRGVAGKRLGDLQKVKGSRYRRSGRLRLTPASIYQVADGDHAEALRLLKLHGYIT